MRGLVDDLKFWPGLAAIGLEVAGLGLLGLLVLESRGPTCVVSMCEGAHVPSPGLMLAIIAIGIAGFLTFVALVLAGMAGLAWRSTRRSGDALTVVVGLAALAAQWGGAAVLGNRGGVLFPIEFVAGVVLIGSYFAVVSGIAPLAIGWGVFSGVRNRRLERRPTLAAFGGLAAIGLCTLWLAVGLS